MSACVIPVIYMRLAIPDLFYVSSTRVAKTTGT